MQKDEADNNDVQKSEEKDIEEEATCVLCSESIQVYATGACNHPLCHVCALRMRVLQENDECPFCRRNMDQVSHQKQFVLH